MAPVYRIEDDVWFVDMARTGTHSDLFGKQILTIKICGGNQDRLETVNPDNWRLRLKVSDATKKLCRLQCNYAGEGIWSGKQKQAYVIYNDTLLWEWHYIMTVQSLTHMIKSVVY